MRKTATPLRGWIGLIKKGSLKVVGAGRLVDTLPRLTWEDYDRHFRKLRIPRHESRASFDLGYRVPWVLADARRLGKPVPYEHQRGAMSRVVLSGDVARAVLRQLPREATQS